MRPLFLRPPFGRSGTPRMAPMPKPYHYRRPLWRRLATPTGVVVGLLVLALAGAAWFLIFAPWAPVIFVR